jgi:hypothetical protein
VANYTNRVPTGKYVELKDWDIQNRCLKTNSKTNQLLNKLLSDKINSWWQHMYQLEADGKTVTLTLATDFFNENADQTFYQFLRMKLPFGALKTRWKIL